MGGTTRGGPYGLECFAASTTAGRDVFTYSGEMAGLPVSDSPSILNRSYTIPAEVEVAEGGSEGMIVTEGGRFGGYALYLLEGKPVFLYNGLGLARFRLLPWGFDRKLFSDPEDPASSGHPPARRSTILDQRAGEARG